MSDRENPANGAPRLDVRGMTKRFGPLVALNDVSVCFEPGSVHALLGENGAGKSTLVKCIMGYHRPDAGQVMLDGVLRGIENPRDAHAAGLGMVYQHFTLVPSMTVAENLILARPTLPSLIDWPNERRRIEAFQQTMPFRIDPDRPVYSLAAGEKQKLEILKQLFLDRRILILDEPTSVLTPDEADEVLGLLRGMTRRAALTVIMITHKFREVFEFADVVTVLRSGEKVAEGPVGDFGSQDFARIIVGDKAIRQPAPRRETTRTEAALELRGLAVDNDRGVVAVDRLDLGVGAGEIVGLAGVSGNGQRELVEALAGQRPIVSGRILVNRQPYRRTRAEMRAHQLSILPEEPLHNGCVRRMSVAENLALTTFDRPETTIAGYLINRRAIDRRARALIREYNIRTTGPEARLDTLSGGNVQRAVLARELSQPVSVLVVHNPCFGLDVAAVADIRNQIVTVRNGGAAVLLISEDLDEILELSDRVLVMFEGRVVYETPREAADLHEIGYHMASHA